MLNLSKGNAEKISVEIMSERVLPIFMGDLPPRNQIAVTWRPVGGLPRTIFVLDTDVEPEKPAELLKQIQLKKGPLYDKWVSVRAKKIREAIQEEKAPQPEKISV